VHPIQYAVEPAYRELGELLGQRRGVVDHEWTEALSRAIDALAGLTAVDGATLITDRYALLAFGAKITRRSGSTAIGEILVTEPIEGGTTERMHPGQLGGSWPRRTAASRSSRGRHATTRYTPIASRRCCSNGVSVGDAPFGR
jgi:hypothetical protein